MANAQDLTVGPIFKHFRTLAIPMAIGMVFTTLYNVVDTFYAGILSTEAQAGLAISFQVFFLVVSFGFGLNSALSALVGKALGEKRAGQAKRIACQGISYAVIASVALAILGVFVGPKLISMISAPGEYRDAGIAYFYLLLLGSPGFLIAFGANGIWVRKEI